MRRIVEYQMPKDVFMKLIDSLKEQKYYAHGYFGKGVGTIDDGSSTNFDYNKEFSIFKELELDKTIELRVKNSRLVNLINGYFGNQKFKHSYPQ